ncbi:hypothetical protein LTR56_004921 [Elasticomyces elasticus]|nr:hypothetical protein LTR56_004921 [Elasticomyces elasticus]KAK3664693.1 hypothetical protein LTR22_004563 [Elasticomyces elasticus]KAK4913718.1 hypothetical protein LTR49_017973 [Elasticomyces elasticus]KAK5754772.1 hypothetical protein LTS12_015183 [Elasticomyces elasticus]
MQSPQLHSVTAFDFSNAYTQKDLAGDALSPVAPKTDAARYMQMAGQTEERFYQLLDKTIASGTTILPLRQAAPTKPKQPLAA